MGKENLKCCFGGLKIFLFGFLVFFSKKTVGVREGGGGSTWFMDSLYSLKCFIVRFFVICSTNHN